MVAAAAATTGQVAVALESDNQALVKGRSGGRPPWQTALLAGLTLLAMGSVPLVYFLLRKPSPVVTHMKKLRTTTPWSANRTSIGRRLSTVSGALEGAAYSDYSAVVHINSQSFEVIVDTGSPTFAVSASSSGCPSASHVMEPSAGRRP